MDTVADDGSTNGVSWFHRQTVVVAVLALTTSMSVGFAVAEGISELTEADSWPVVPMSPEFGPQPPVVLPEQPAPPTDPASEPREPGPAEPDPAASDGESTDPGITIDLESSTDWRPEPPEFVVPDDEPPGGDGDPVSPPDFWESLPIDVCDEPAMRPLCDLAERDPGWVEELLPGGGSGWDPTDPGGWPRSSF